MRRQFRARWQSRTRVAAAPALYCGILAGCMILLGGCGPSLNSEFATLDLPAEHPPPARLTSAGDAKPATRAADKLTSVATPGASGYKIGPLDVLEFSVFKVPELTRTAQVAETGTVNLPLVGEIQAAGKTARDVERDLTAKLKAEYLQSPQVTILVREYNSQRVTIEGAVKKPGVFPIRGQTSLLQVIATAEGLQALSDNTVVIFRRVDGKRMAARFDVEQIRTGATVDPAIQSGDVIVAPTSAMKGAFETILKSLPLTTVFALL